MEHAAGWRLVDDIDKNLSTTLRRYFAKPALLCAAIHDEDAAREIVDLAFGGHFGLARRNAQKFDPSVRREARVMLWGREGGDDSCKRVKVDAGEVYINLISSSLTLGLATLRKYLKKQPIVPNKQEKEDRRKRCWALRLASFIEEAKLPVCQAVEKSSDANSMWCRAFGSRRSNTLKHRATIWERFREWMLTTFGII